MIEALRQIDAWPVPNAAVAVVAPDGLVGQRGDLSYSGPWASVTKLFTAYAVLMAIQDEEFSLDDPAGPEGATVRHVLAHASGLPFEGEVAIARPGTHRIYSNAGFDLLGRVISKRCDQQFADYLQLQVLEPLGIGADLVGRPSEGLAGDLGGLIAFAKELLAPSLVDPELFGVATTVAFPGLSGTLPGIGRYDLLDWGLGFEIRDGKEPHWTARENSPETFGHFGGTGSFLWVDPRLGLAMCGLSGRQFDNWAMTAWPALAEAVIAELG
ncbi:MAG TPA: serine hydrolase domain-containing protein [Acidimicrobiia bacterium]|nr:serine hydrolase domain-containing protein [Acidimicrobiia bacterium]